MESTAVSGTGITVSGTPAATGTAIPASYPASQQQNPKQKSRAELLAALKARFPEEVVEYREGPKKKMPDGTWVEQKFAYIPTDYVKERLDEVFPLAWSWRIHDDKMIEFDKEKFTWDSATRQKIPEMKPHHQVIVHGELEVTFSDGGPAVIIAGYGGAEIGQGVLPGDQFKIASSNALRKAAYLLGVGSYIGLQGGAAESEKAIAAASAPEAEADQGFVPPQFGAAPVQSQAPRQSAPRQGSFTRRKA